MKHVKHHYQDITEIRIKISIRCLRIKKIRIVTDREWYLSRELAFERIFLNPQTFHNAARLMPSQMCTLHPTSVVAKETHSPPLDHEWRFTKRREVFFSTPFRRAQMKHLAKLCMLNNFTSAPISPCMQIDSKRCF